MTSEELLLSQLRNPSLREKAFEQLINQYKERLYWQIRRMVINHEDADDILQNTFIKVWQALDQFRGESQLGTWIYRIASNETLSYINKRKRNLWEQSIDNEGENPANQLESDPFFDGNETERQLQEAIGQLPEKQREVFLLKYYEGMRYEEMSRLLGTSIGALKANYHHAVKKITDFFIQND